MLVDAISAQYSEAKVSRCDERCKLNMVIGDLKPPTFIRGF